MKLRDIISTVREDRLCWINFDFNWNITPDGRLIPVEKAAVTLDTNIDIMYQWFWHCNRSIDTKEICNAISNHDYATFKKWYDMYKYDNLIYFPSEAYMFVRDECIGTICVVYDKEVFSLITDQDYECG